MNSSVTLSDGVLVINRDGRTRIALLVVLLCIPVVVLVAYAHSMTALIVVSVLACLVLLSFACVVYYRIDRVTRSIQTSVLLCGLIEKEGQRFHVSDGDSVLLDMYDSHDVITCTIYLVIHKTAAILRLHTTNSVSIARELGQTIASYLDIPIEEKIGPTWKR